MSQLDTRQDSLNSAQQRGIPFILLMVLAMPTTASTTTDLNVNLDGGVAVIPPHVSQKAAVADFDCGAAIVDGESLPVTIVAYFSPAMQAILQTGVEGTSHTTPAADTDSRAYYATDAEIEAALPTDVEDTQYTVIGVAIFKRSGSTVTQVHDLAPRSYGLEEATKYIATGESLTNVASPETAGTQLAAIQSGVVTVLNGQTSIAAGTFAGLDAKPVQLTFAEAPTAAAKLHYVWNGSDVLTVHIDADNTADIDIAYSIDGR